MEITGRIIRIGNSRGIILPGKIIEHYGFNERVEMIMEKEQLVLRPAGSPRQGWDEAFRRMNRAGDDELLLPDLMSEDLMEDWDNEDGDQSV